MLVFGRDVGETSSGKTLAYLLSFLLRLVNEKAKGPY